MMFNVIKYSLLENLRNKFYLASIGIILFIVWLSHYSSQINYNYGNYTMAILTFGMYFTKLVAFAFIIFLPVTNLSQEIETGTIYFILSKKIERYKYLVAKYIAFLLLYLTLLVLSSIALWLLTYVLVKERPEISFKLVYFVYAELLSGAMVLSLVFFIYTAIRAPIVTATVSAVTFFFSLMLESAKDIADRADTIFVKYFYLFLYYIFPNFRYFNLEKNIVYDKPIDPGYLLAMLAYSAAFSMILLLGSSLIFKHREL
ncbi:MAG: ABC transporter permease [Candidatus Aureabacteria bacterium]|nr:ABC transporter permease [Candidatus Auribacterota bacterium]